MKSRIVLFSAIVLLSWLLSLRSEMSGERGRSSSSFVGELNPGDTPTNQCMFSIEIDRVTFKLNSLKNKYKLVRVRLENMMSGPIRLSREGDSIELELSDGKVVRGTFNLQGRDGQLWDALSDDTRKALAYPLFARGVKGDEASPRRPEVIYVFAFFPADEVPEMPRVFRYKIQSVGKTIVIKSPPQTAA
jgi:hypothetical protein